MNQENERTTAASEPEPGTRMDENGIPHCVKCGAPLKKRTELVDFMGISRVFMVEELCPCMEAARREREQRAERDRRYLEAWSKWSGSRFYREGIRDMSFRRDDAPDSEAARVCRNYADQWERMRKEGCGLLLMGPVGTGKTFYAAAIMNRVLHEGDTCAMVSAPQLVNLCMNGQSEDVMRELNRFGLVILDDLGAERETDFALEQLELFMDARYASGRPLIVTTNLTKAELDDPSDRRRTRIYDRAKQMACVPVLLTGRSRRGAAARDKARRMRELLGAGA